MGSTTTQIDQKDLHQTPYFAQGVIIPTGKTVYVGGQNGTDSNGDIVEGGAEAQTAQAMRNVLSVLAAAGSGPEHVARLGIYVVAGVDIQAGFAASQAIWDQHRTGITVLTVAGLARPGALVEIEATALIPE